MKRYIYIFCCKLLALVALLSSCGGGGSVDGRSISDWCRQMDDSLRCMNTSFVRTSVNEKLEHYASGDKDFYYMALMQKAKLLCYTSSRDSILTLCDSVQHYLGSTSPTLERRRLQMVCLQVRAIYYSKFALDIDSVIIFNRKAVSIADEISDSYHKVVLFNNLGDAYIMCGDLVKAVDCFRHAVHIGDSISVPKHEMAVLYQGLGRIYTEMRSFDQSSYWWDKAFELWDSTDVKGRFTYMNNRGNDYFFQNRYVDALAHFSALDKMLASHPDMAWERNICRVNILEIYINQGQLAQARRLYPQLHEYFEKNGADYILTYLYTLEMCMAYRMGDYAAVDSMLEVHPLPKSVPVSIAMARYKLIRDFSKDVGRWKDAYTSGEEYTRMSDSLRDERVKMKIADLHLKYMRDEKILSDKVRMSELHTHLLWLYFGVAFLLFVILISIVVIYYRRRQVHAREAVMLSNIVKLRMQNIRNRITPHFIYNALNHEEFATAQGRASQLHVLVELLRQGQELAGRFCISLSDELNFIDMYVSVESRAVGPNFIYDKRMSSGLNPSSVMLPSMMVQIFVENAMKHGLKALSPDVCKKLVIRVTDRTNDTLVEVLNNGRKQGDHSSDKRVHIGLRVVSQTIQLLNEHNVNKMNYRFYEYGYDEEFKTFIYCASLTIPKDYSFEIN